MLVSLTNPAPDGPRDRHTIGSVALSIALHGLIVFALAGTAQKVVTMPRRVDPDTIIWDVTRSARRAAPPPATTAGPAFVLPPDAFARRLVIPAAAFPDGIPPITDEPFDPRALASHDGPPGGPRPALGAPRSAPGVVYDPRVVDEPPLRLAGPPARYPPMLRAAGLEGRAVVEVVIDTLGHAEPETVEVVETTHAGFIDEARAAVLRSVYRPGRVQGQAVRVRIRQPVVFRLDA